MLSLKLIASPSMAVRYYEQDDYYTQGADDLRTAGEWYGRGLDRLGVGDVIGEPVGREDFRRLLEGELPQRPSLGRVIGGERVHTPGWDLTFSAPKSVSILAELGGDTRLHAAHQWAVKATLAWLESDVIRYRQSGAEGVAAHPSGNLIAALFQHATSREKDPHLFRHAMATLMLEGGADIRSIQAMLGHADLGTTAIYTQVAIRALKAIHSATHPADAKLRRHAEPQAHHGAR